MTDLEFTAQLRCRLDYGDTASVDEVRLLLEIIERLRFEAMQAQKMAAEYVWDLRQEAKVTR